VTVSLSALHTRAIVLDIEGTTTPVAFVYDVLFPFARARVADFLQREGSSSACQDAVALLDAERAADLAKGDAPPEPMTAYVHWLMDRDRKSRGLKALQGLIWKDGYRSGELHGQVYPDVPPALARWQAHGLSTYIYSSGSVLAQQLIFGSTSAGDLTKYLRGYFDTEVGPKTAADSYRQIAHATSDPPVAILFVSDVAAELDAARAADMRTALCMRSGAAVIAGPHPVIHTFDDISD
jgi:enolase-phosphatase E1